VELFLSSLLSTKILLVVSHFFHRFPLQRGVMKYPLKEPIMWGEDRVAFRTEKRHDFNNKNRTHFS